VIISYSYKLHDFPTEVSLFVFYAHEISIKGFGYLY